MAKKTCNLLAQTNRVEVNIRKEHIAREQVSDLCIFFKCICREHSSKDGAMSKREDM